MVLGFGPQSFSLLSTIMMSKSCCPPTGHWINVLLPQGRWLPAMAWAYLASKLGKQEEQVSAVLPAVTQAQTDGRTWARLHCL